jgi:small subunit ribosomal protein S20
MANSVSSKKNIRQTLKRNAVNRTRRSALRTQLKKVDDALEAKDPVKLEEELRLAAQKLDKLAKTNVIHRNAAARKKSRLQMRLNALKAATK